MPGHVPVLLSEVLAALQPKQNDNIIDCTLGGGGHASALLRAIAPDGRLLGVEADERTLKQTQQSLAEFGGRFLPVHGNFRDLKTIAADASWNQVDGILIDLGISSMTIEDPARGFSFQKSGPLDMRFDQTHQTLTAAEIVNTWPSADLQRIFVEYGDEPLARRIADHLTEVRKSQKFSTTDELAAAIETVKARRGKLHPATQVFQALRIAVNDELGAITDVLPQALHLLKPDGRLAVISFHSLEDSLVKTWSREAARASEVTLVNKHVIVPGREEQVENPRSRSAKLRIIQKNSPSK